MVIFILFMARHHKYRIMYVWVKLIAERIEFFDIKFTQNLVHHDCGHLLALHNILHLSLEHINIISRIQFLHIYVL